MQPPSGSTSPGRGFRRALAAGGSVAVVVGGAFALGFLDPLLDSGGASTVELVERPESVRGFLRERSRSGPSPARPGRVIEPVPREHASFLAPSLDRPSMNHFDPLTLFEARPAQRLRKRFPEHPDGFLRIETNDRGFRESGDVRADRPDLRVLVTGDSHTAGVVQTHESLANVLEAELAGAQPSRSVEVLNAACGGYDFYNYLGVLEKHLSLRPHVFVMVVYGGNDFVGAAFLHRYHRRLPPAPADPEFAAARRAAAKASRPAFSQSLDQALTFRRFPEEEALGLEAARDVVAEVSQRCAEEGVRFVCVYLPGPVEVDPGFRHDAHVRVCEAFGVPVDEVVAAVGRPGRRFVALVRELGVELLDLLAPFRSAQEPLFWSQDHHLNVAGHRLVARELRALLD